jgi:hypothetical protein
VLAQVGLTRFADTPCALYSGGNKRKLSLGVALVADEPPVLLLLDEPSSGMDPYSKRHMWEVIGLSLVAVCSSLFTVSQESYPRTTAWCSQRTAWKRQKHCAHESVGPCVLDCSFVILSAVRAGIMVGGKLRCIGSAQHLRDKFGAGYQGENIYHDGVAR